MGILLSAWDGAVICWRGTLVQKEHLHGAFIMSSGGFGFSSLMQSSYLCLHSRHQIQLLGLCSKVLVEQLIAKFPSWIQIWDAKYVVPNLPGRMEIYSKRSTESRSIILYYSSAQLSR